MHKFILFYKSNLQIIILDAHTVIFRNVIKLIATKLTFSTTFFIKVEQFIYLFIGEAKRIAL